MFPSMALLGLANALRYAKSASLALVQAKSKGFEHLFALRRVLREIHQLDLRLADVVPCVCLKRDD